MIVIELEEKQYGKTMEAVSMIKKATECLEEMFEEHSVGRGSMGYRGGSMSRRDEYAKDKRHEYEKYDREYPEYDRMEHRGDYGRRYM